MRTASYRRRRRTRTATVVATLITTALAVTSCASGGSSDSSGSDKLKIVTSTSMWGSVAKAVGGDAVEVEPVISNDEADPHSYKSTPRDAAKILDADLVIYNGGGYDSFIPQTLSGNGRSVPTVRAVESPHGSSGHEHGHEHSGNEHVWYDLSAVQEMTGKITGKLGELRPAETATFQRSAETFHSRLGELQGRVDRIKSAHGGAQVLATAPVADLLLEQAGLNDITPPSFVHSVESGNDPSAAATARVRDLVKSGRAAVLVHNPQTSSPLTKRIESQAEHAGIPVVEMGESLPEGRTYLEWMGARISKLRTALDNPA
ncbi:zinc/manganese transport system substrate-binding protein [Saccharopolyspora lacisalsi]|uniref:Zinc/manganese transport system substrate-binding protein n=1 Tax=Halosaccharopolyspora lacisalsi TaxID=1000566 RepID=A0A839E491_9PSEU|nr:zinc ABC transporter substrate-binding protein [Halosaccharopolyspora lacisalsi]MBA8826625.1 zinc/manganese transport system substrate-binding protein [Halosaccharopolyspora lacisalsi]